MVHSAVAAFNRGDRRTAESLTEQVEQLSHEIVEGLDRLERMANARVLNRQKDAGSGRGGNGHSHGAGEPGRGGNGHAVKEAVLQR
jgi:hypothetical protein